MFYVQESSFGFISFVQTYNEQLFEYDYTDIVVRNYDFHRKVD